MSRTELLLSNCAYWAMNALGIKGSLEHVNKIQQICLRNILRVSREFISDDPRTDSRVCYEGVSATLIPEEGWLTPEVEWMNG